MSDTPIIEALHVTKAYLNREDEIQALEPVSFKIRPGEFVSLVGSSGCGKSTVLSLVAGLIQPTEGEVRIAGEKVESPNRRVSYMLQRDCLLDWRTVEENIALGLEFRGMDDKKTRKQAHFLLEELGLEHTAKQFPSQLSGGMRQRVALVRTLAVQPEILLLDEPFSAVDYQNKLHLEELLIRALETRSMTVLLVTHDLEEALAMSDRILVMGGRPGKIRRTLKVPEELRSASPLEARGASSFRPLFEVLWKEMEL
ncbi:ABC transporter ATP-binding protein [Kroppenstedtia eburnea]|uniref:NitT/TauT family transport system ATP-binding protein n=1 Tax=Kroppenstedtia eburnea TaxID=714067 RepID=A0A1N7M2D1_9BACL|nr:ABC transporter ATP-binding protein [Kroppenstedtia eburnea]QKI81784.1 ABC transporter ATP-binding protein [Kroppenstedtia eburnea]SIS80101.1 NitT/TauT family transport system ATP-binding protein [Kroppenstedtia eburnea]